MLNVQFDTDTLRPLIALIVAEVLAAHEDLQGQTDGQFLFDDNQAALFLGLKNGTQVRDLRLRGELAFTKIVGNRPRILKSDLIEYAMKNRSESRI